LRAGEGFLVPGRKGRSPDVVHRGKILTHPARKSAA